MLTTSSWQRQGEDTSIPEVAGASTEAAQFPGKWQQIQYDFYFTVHWFSLWREKVSSEIKKRHTRAIRKNEVRILGKVILDTWRFILGYIAKYRWILFRGSFLLSDSLLLCVFSWTHWGWKRQTPPPQRGAGVSTEAVQFPGKWQQIPYDFYFTVRWFSLWRGKVHSEIWKRQTDYRRGKNSL